MNLAIWLHRTSRQRPAAPALRDGERLCATYAEFALRSSTIGRFLEETCGVGRGDRVALFAMNCTEYLEILYGVLWIGATVVPINYKLHPREASWIVENSGAKFVFTEAGSVFGGDQPLPAGCREIGIRSDGFRAAVAAATEARYSEPRETSDDDVAWLFYTSGTTGRPKGAMLTCRNLRTMAYSYMTDVDTATQHDNKLYAAPMSHGAGLYSFQFVKSGACHVVPASRGFDPAEIQELATKFGNLCLFAAPTMVKRLVTHAAHNGYSGEGIRTVIYGGGPMYLADIDEAVDLMGPKFVQIYGQGESPMTITALPRDLVADRTGPRSSHRRASVGFAVSCVDVRVANDRMEPLPPGEVGEILVRGDTVMKGYWQNDKATRETIVGGWLKTGDLGVLDEDGCLTLTDRSKDVIISGGTNIYPREVEEALLTHRSVFEVSVVGEPSPEWGEDVVAFLVLKGGEACDEAELNNWCKTQIASFKKPKRYIFVSELPKNSYGKVLKTELRRMLAEARPATA